MTSPCPQPGADAFHRERSRFLDTFAECEEIVCGLLRNAGVCESNTAPFAQRIKAMRERPASPAYAKARKAQVDAALARLSGLMLVRADIVHARLRLAILDGETVACFINARDAGETGPPARLLTLASLRLLRSDLADIAAELARLSVSPASSPPPPSPAVTTGP